MEFEAIVNGRAVIVQAEGSIGDLIVTAIDKETEEEVTLSREDETRLWQEAYEREIDAQCAYADSLRDQE